MTTKNKVAAFQIIANVSFVIPRTIKGAFNTYHKSRLANLGAGKGEVTKEGAAFFSNRARMEEGALVKALADAKFSLYDAGGFIWAQNVHKTQWIPGQGNEGKTLFANALSALSQDAHNAATKAKATTAKPKATAKKATAVKAKA